MASPPKRRPGGRTARTREAVLSATLDELAENGYTQLSLERVATRAGVHKTTVYRRWGNKARLVGDAHQEFAETRVPLPNTGSLEDDLVALATSVRDNLDSALGHAIAAAWAAEPEARELSQVAKAFWNSRFQTAETIIERAIERGELPKSNPTLLVEMLVAPLYFRRLITRQPTSDAQLRELARRVIASATPAAPKT